VHTVAVSPKYQVVIPKNIREALRLRPEQKMKVVEQTTGQKMVFYTG